MDNTKYKIIRELNRWLNEYLIKAPGAPPMIAKIKKASLPATLLLFADGYYDPLTEKIFYRSKEALKHELEHFIWDRLSKDLFGVSLEEILGSAGIEVLNMYFREKIGEIPLSEKAYLSLMELIESSYSGTFLRFITFFNFTYTLSKLLIYSSSCGWNSPKCFLVMGLYLAILYFSFQFLITIEAFHRYSKNGEVKMVKKIIDEAFELGIPLEGELPEDLREKFPEFYSLLKRRCLEKYPLRCYILWRIYQENRK